MPFRKRGPFALSDEVRMTEAILTLRRSLDSGKYQKHIQYETTRRIRVGFFTYWHAPKELSNTSVITNDTVKTTATAAIVDRPSEISRPLALLPRYVQRFFYFLLFMVLLKSSHVNWKRYFCIENK